MCSLIASRRGEKNHQTMSSLTFPVILFIFPWLHNRKQLLILNWMVSNKIIVNAYLGYFSCDNVYSLKANVENDFTHFFNVFLLVLYHCKNFNFHIAMNLLSQGWFAFNNFCQTIVFTVIFFKIKFFTLFGVFMGKYIW